MTEVLEKLFDAADNHEVSTGEDHTVGDLQELLLEVWSLLTPSQKLDLLEPGGAADAIVEAGAEGDYELEDLADLVLKEVAGMEAEVMAAGYCIIDGEHGFFWETEHCDGRDLSTREDAVADAHRHMQEMAAH